MVNISVLEPTPVHKKQRFLFAREHQYWSQEWNNIIWSDEAHFEVLNRKNRTFVRRLRSEADKPFNFVAKVQGGGVDGRAYVKIIEKFLPSFIENAFDSSNKNWIFMHDNAPPHRSKYTMKWLQDKENLWDHIDKKLTQMKPTNVTQSEQMVQTIWSGITYLQCKTLVDSMPCHINQFKKMFWVEHLVNTGSINCRLDQLIYIPLPNDESRVAILKTSLRKLSVAKDVDMDYLTILQENSLKKKQQHICSTTMDSGEPAPVPEIRRDHFDEAMKFARRSVSDKDISEYEIFATKLQRDFQGFPTE
ncbi:unnamed protein product [Rotaria socialis]|uniref:Uncharacterized protein n=1 Tax=Rotaria socialis TaxID=392032 RepID=A0A821U3F0_9BILA|nr:unnamed protein product [Rotaria socialis]